MATLATEFFTGSVGAAWPVQWAAIGGTPGGTAAQTGQRTGTITTAAAAYANAREVLTGPAQGLYGSLVADWSLDDVGEAFTVVGARTGTFGSPLPDTGYAAQLYTRAWDRHCTFGIYRSKVLLDEVALAVQPAAGERWRTRLECFGGLVRARTWRADDLEPTGWQVQATDSSPLAAGYIGWLAVSTGADGLARTAEWANVVVVSTAQPGVRVSGPVTRTLHTWQAWARTTDYAPSVALPIRSVSGVLRHLGVSTVTVETMLTGEAWQALAEGAGVTIYRDGKQLATGLLNAHEADWDAESGAATISVEVVGDEQHLADRLVFPDPLRAPDDQTVNDYWTYTGVASTAMRQLISDQAGPTCAADRQVPGLVLGADPGVGASRKWTGLFNDAGPAGVLDKLAQISVASGEDLGLRVTASPGALTYDIVQPHASGCVFSADLGNLAGFTYRGAAPTVTDAVSAGSGDLHARIRKWVKTTSSLALAWGRRIFSYVDRRDTADATELINAASDEVAQGDVTVNLVCTLLDSESARWRIDWDLGSTITVHVGLPGSSKLETVTDVVREVAFEVDDTGKESVTTAVGSHDATSVIPSPSQRKLATVGAGLAGLKSNK